MKIRFLSFYRILNELPLLIRLLMIGILFISGYALVLSNLTFTFTNYLYCLGIYVVVGNWLCRIDPGENVLIKSLDISAILVLIVKGILLCVPFFFLNMLIGSLLIPTGIFLLVLFSRIRYRKGWVVPSFFPPASYQWISVWRVEGVWVYLIGVLLLIAGLRYENGNLLRFTIIWTVCLPCFLAYYKRQDPRHFLCVYKSPNLLIWKKSGELLMNSLLSLVVPIVLFFIFGIPDTTFFLWVIGGITGNFLLLYVNYIAYPSQLRALCFFCALCILYTILYIEAYPWGPIFGLLLFPVLYFFSYLNLKTNLYVQPISEN